MQFDENLEPVYDNSMYGSREDRFNETQREWFYSQMQMRYSETLDKSDKLIIERVLRLKGVKIYINIDESIEDYLFRGETELLKKEMI